MKKFVIFFLALVLFIFLSVFLAVKICEDRIVNTFKKQIIDKTSLNINFSEIHFSVLKNFPYGSFILDDAQIFYSKTNSNDTLICAKKISFKINLLNLFSRFYEFPEIIITDGIINLDYDKLDLLLSKEKNSNQENVYHIVTKKIKINRCIVKYRYKEIVKLNLFLDHSFCSGAFLSNALELRLDLSIYSLTGSINKFTIKTQNLVEVSTTIGKRDDIYRSSNGLITFKSMPFGFAFTYTPKTDELKISTKAKNLSAKVFCSSFLNSWNIGISTGILSFDLGYDINFNHQTAQKLTVKYVFDNFTFSKYKDFEISKLIGTTRFTGDFDKNNSDITNFSMRYLGLEIEGSSKIKNIAHPLALIDCRFRKRGEVNLSNSYTINGNFSGKLKSLIKINDINNININTLNISKITSEIIFSNLYIKNVEQIRNLKGDIFINDNRLEVKGSGFLLNYPFNGVLEISNFLGAVFQKGSISPIMSIDMEQFNIDSIPIKPSISKDTSATLKYVLNTTIRKLLYKGFTINDFSLGLKVDNGKYRCDQFSMNVFKGTMSGNFIYSKNNGYNISMLAQSIDIHKLFTCFNNFGQSTITNKNISGSLSGKLDLSFKKLSNGNVNPQSIKLTSNLVIENGRLIGVTQLKKVSKFLNINEFDSIHFETIRNNIDVEQGFIKIPSMDIASNAVNFSITGQHAFNGEYSYWVKVNLREILAKKYLSHNHPASEYENDDKKGLNLFLKINGNNDSYKVSFDKKNSVERIKSSFNQEGLLLKSILNEEFSKSKKDGSQLIDTILPSRLNKLDSIHNKNQKKPFRIEWDEIDSTKNL